MIKIKNEQDFTKVFAFIKAKVKEQFILDEELVKDFIEIAKSFCEENNISIEFINPDDERVIIFTATGALVGAATGFALAGVFGGVVGTGVGALGGYGLSHVKIVLNNSKDGSVTLD